MIAMGDLNNIDITSTRQYPNNILQYFTQKHGLTSSIPHLLPHPRPTYQQGHSSSHIDHILLPHHMLIQASEPIIHNAFTKTQFASDHHPCLISILTRLTNPKPRGSSLCWAGSVGAVGEDAIRAKLKKEHDHKEPKGKVPSKKRETKRSFQGVARFCQMCKNAGMPEVKYTSHNTDKCSNKGKYETNLSGSQGRREEAKKCYDKNHKKENKMFKKVNKVLMAR
eukprot:scaffold1521_cov271-Chaetoceros_neogracile.AAC.68